MQKDEITEATAEKAAAAMWSAGYNPTGLKKWPEDVIGESQDLFRRMARAALNPAFLARIEALEAENAELHELLKPFAQIADMEEREADGASVMVNVSRCRDARAAIARTTQEVCNAEG